LPRFFDPALGSVLFDSRDIRSVNLRSLRSQIAVVTQQTVIFADTVRANIAYGQPEIPLERVIDAAKRAYAHEFIELLPDGYDTVLSEAGENLSGGQRQRISIARAILRDPQILILDEATSSIDADSEAKITKALSKFTTGRTCFVVAHRFATVMAADFIVVMDDGRIVATGTHEQLMQTCPLYHGLYETQLHHDI
jgi:subfamily B ATP-binding cassette protein MsbA